MPRDSYVLRALRLQRRHDMRAFLVLMSLLNVGLAALSGYFAVRAPFVFDTGGAVANAGDVAREPVVPFALVAAYPVFCLIAATLPLVLHERGVSRAAIALSLLPSVIAVSVVAVTRI